MEAPQNYLSVSRRPPDVEDYIDIMRRYRSWIIGPTFAGLVIAVVVAYFWPDMYVCSAAMEIKPSAVSTNLLPTLMTNQIQTRLTELNLEILSRDNLIALLQNPALDLYKKEKARYSVTDVADETLRKHIHIDKYDLSGSTGQAFRIWFEYPDKNKARALVVELVGEYQAKDAILQTTNASSTSTLFEDLLKTSRARMDKAQMDIADFTSENRGRLPENYDANSLNLQTKLNMIRDVQNQIGQEKQRQTLLESNLSNNKNLQSQNEQNLTATVTTPMQAVTNSSLIDLEHSINTKQAECTALLRTFQADFPEVQACNDEVRSLQSRKDFLQKQESPSLPQNVLRTVANPEAAVRQNQLKADENNINSQIRASVMQVDTLNQELAQLNQELRDVQDKINSSPTIIQKYNALAQELQMAKDDYANVSREKGAAGTEKTMEEHRAGETLVMLENPITPEKPTWPPRAGIVAIGTMIGLMFGVALAGAKEVKNTSLKNLKDVRAYTNLPVLSSIPLLENALLVRRKRRLAWLAWSLAMVVGTVLMSGAVYYHYFMLQQV
jgi:polysaccharide biosynthesis transport protein